MSFIEWLNFKKTAGSKTPLKNKKNESSKNLKKEIKTKSKSNSKSGINDLLDKFINEQPSISKPVKEFYNPSTNAKKSIEESTDLVSETLAKIHFMQGNYKKAISAYKKLSLLYPEKRAFFASQIEKIKDKQSH